jgi:hypothetical protein
MPKNNKKARMASTFEKKRKDQIYNETHATRVLFLSIYQKRGCRGSPLKITPNKFQGYQETLSSHVRGP